MLSYGLVPSLRPFSLVLFVDVMQLVLNASIAVHLIRIVAMLAGKVLVHEPGQLFQGCITCVAFCDDLLHTDGEHSTNSYLINPGIGMHFLI